MHGISQAGIPEWLPFPPPKDLPNPGIEPRSPTFEADALPPEPPRKLLISEKASFWDSFNLARALNPLILPCFHRYIFSSFLLFLA